MREQTIWTMHVQLHHPNQEGEKKRERKKTKKKKLVCRYCHLQNWDLTMFRMFLFILCCDFEYSRLCCVIVFFGSSLTALYLSKAVSFWLWWPCISLKLSAFGLLPWKLFSILGPNFFHCAPFKESHSLLHFLFFLSSFGMFFCCWLSTGDTW